MIIGVVSDTHSIEIPKQMLEVFKKADLIIHAGDFCSEEEYNIFSKIKEVKAVYGNMDDAALRQKFSEHQVFSMGGIQVGIYHGEGPAQHVIDSVKRKFKTEKVDVVVFGHSHHPFNECIDGVLYFNPGSPNDRVFAPYCSYGLLTIDNGKVTGKIVKVGK